MISPQNILVDRIPRHVRELCPDIGLDTSESGRDSKLLTQSDRMITINEVRGDPQEINTLQQVTFLQTSHPRRKWYYHGGALDTRDPPRFVICVIIRSLGGVVKLKGRTCRLLSLTSQLGFIIQRDHEWRAVVYVNSAIIHGWIKIKQVVNRVNERWNVTMKLCELNSFHSNTERK